MVDAVSNAANLQPIAPEPDALFVGDTTSTNQEELLLFFFEIDVGPIIPESSDFPGVPLLVLVRDVNAPMGAADFASEQVSPVLPIDTFRYRANLPGNTPARGVVIVFGEFRATAGHAVWLTSKISHTCAWRGLCISTERDKHTCWL